MARTPDAFPGTRLDEGLILDSADPAVQVGEVRFASGSFSMFDDVGEFNPRSGSLINDAAHEELDTLAHFIIEDSFDEVIYEGSPTRIASVTTWDSVAKTAIIREQLYNYSPGAGCRVTEIIDVQYDATPLPKYAITSSITFVGPTNNRVESITRTRQDF